MNADDLRTLTDLTARARAAVTQLRRLVQWLDPQTSIAPLARDLDQLLIDVGELTDTVQDREARSWRHDHPPRHPAPARLIG